METDNKKNKICYCAGRGLCSRAVGRQNKQLNTYDWLADVPGNDTETDLVEVQFKNTRKAYFHNVNNLSLNKGDIVAVEASPGHDIGVVTLTGRLVTLQIKKANLKSQNDIKRIYRVAKQVDMDKYKEAKSREDDTMIQSRQIAKKLGLKMKIGDVEYQGDGNKAIFYYIADERVDFRQLIKVLAETFHVRIEMKQIGARQEAGRIGGTGPCGRELCCATWMKSFVSVSTNAARFQDISLNPQKLAGQCAKLKCCLNYEVDDYVEANRLLPSKEVILQTKDNDYYLFKTDILAGLVTYSTDKNMAANLETITATRAKKVIEMNKQNEKPLTLHEDDKAKKADEEPIDLLTQESVTRFDKNRKKGKNKNNRRNTNAQAAGGNRTDERRERSATGNKPQRRDNREDKNKDQNSREQRSKSREPRNDNREPRNGNREQRNGSREPRNGNDTDNRNTRNDSREPRDNREQRNGNRPPRDNKPHDNRRNDRNNDSVTNTSKTEITDKPQANKPQLNPQSNKPQSDKPQDNGQRSGKPQSDKTQDGKPQQEN